MTEIVRQKPAAKAAGKKKEKKLTFEAGAEELNALIEKLSSEELPLEDTIALYERGVALCAQLNGLLQEQRRRIEQIDPETAEINAFEGNEHGVY